MNKLAGAIRSLTIDAVEQAASGHPGMPLGMADVATVLFRDFLRFDPKHPHWPARDRFVLSCGHGSMLLYALLYLTGYEDMTLEDLKHFRCLHSKTPGHPEHGVTQGVETTTGPLGQGLANAVGFALAERTARARTGDAPYSIYCMVSDGCLMEGISQEAISFAGHQKLDRLVVLFDDNGITIDGKTSLSTSENHRLRFEACGWYVQEIDGHDEGAIQAALHAASKSKKPSLIACKTIIGYGSPHKQGTEKAHGSPLGRDEAAATKKALGLLPEPFALEPGVLEAWRAIGRQHQGTPGTPLSPAGDFKVTLETLKKRFGTPPAESTRKCSEWVLEALQDSFPNMLGGSADLTPSNNTKLPTMGVQTPENPQGAYIHYGIREHAMAAIMNGLALDGRFIPYGGTFLSFSDYMRPAMRLSALMGLPVIYVMTHDSIGLGEDGPTHQPIEHLMSLRLIPGMLVLRPCDLVETLEAWEIALSHPGPTVLALSRQGLPVVNGFRAENKSRLGGYVVAPCVAPHLVLVATGSEVYRALDLKEALAKMQIEARVISMPSPDLFLQQPEAYQRELLGDPSLLKVVLEAGRSQGWADYVGSNALVFGIDSFGASAPGADLYTFFGFETSAMVRRICKKMGIENGS